MSRHRAFPAEVDADASLLILGSLPGAASLAAGEYYAHPRNGFWRLVGGVIGEDLAALPYADRLPRLKAAGIGLWDVIASAERVGSLDAAIRSPEAADLRRLVGDLPALRLIAFNGATAARLGGHRLAGIDVPRVALPSSSPANTLAFERKLAAWREGLAPWRSAAASP